MNKLLIAVLLTASLTSQAATISRVEAIVKKVNQQTIQQLAYNIHWDEPGFASSQLSWQTYNWFKLYTCELNFNKSFITSLTDDSIAWITAHELAHCEHKVTDERKLYPSTKEEYYQEELLADYDGKIYTIKAGYNFDTVAQEMYNKLPKQEGSEHPSVEKRLNRLGYYVKHD